MSTFAMVKETKTTQRLVTTTSKKERPPTLTPKPLESLVYTYTDNTKVNFTTILARNVNVTRVFSLLIVTSTTTEVLQLQDKTTMVTNAVSSAQKSVITTHTGIQPHGSMLPYLLTLLEVSPNPKSATTSRASPSTHVVNTTVPILLENHLNTTTKLTANKQVKTGSNILRTTRERTQALTSDHQIVKSLNGPVLTTLVMSVTA
mmetsp:Transcript_9086/g.10092  ORF Transcript_9086/g.10092 Transcript_9086/m.10092 type:complete len:204 (+) Transcript_9086:401-1012(+)